MKTQNLNPSSKSKSILPNQVCLKNLRVSDPKQNLSDRYAGLFHSAFNCDFDRVVCRCFDLELDCLSCEWLSYDSHTGYWALFDDTHHNWLCLEDGYTCDCFKREDWKVRKNQRSSSLCYFDFDVVYKLVHDEWSFQRLLVIESNALLWLSFWRFLHHFEQKQAECSTFSCWKPFHRPFLKCWSQWS